MSPLRMNCETSSTGLATSRERSRPDSGSVLEVVALGRLEARARRSRSAGTDRGRSHRSRNATGGSSPLTRPFRQPPLRRPGPVVARVLRDGRRLPPTRSSGPAGQRPWADRAPRSKNPSIRSAITIAWVHAGWLGCQGREFPCRSPMGHLMRYWMHSTPCPLRWRRPRPTSRSWPTRWSGCAVAGRGGNPGLTALPPAGQPNLVSLSTRALSSLGVATSRVRTTLARALRTEGLTVREIAALFGVSHQRVSELLARTDHPSETGNGGAATAPIGGQGVARTALTPRSGAAGATVDPAIIRDPATGRRPARCRRGWESAMGGLPSYQDLPAVEGRPPRSSWGLWGDADRYGALNLLDGPPPCEGRPRFAAGPCST